MAISLVTNISTSGGASGGTTSAVDTTGATLLVIVIGYDDGGTPSVSDSKSNSWTGLTNKDSGSVASRIFYVANPTVGSSHTFTVSGAATLSSLCAAAFSGVVTTTPFDVQNGATTGGASTINTGSVTPGSNNELVIAAVGDGGTGTKSIDSGMTITNQVAFTTGNHWGSALAYIVQTTAGAINPKWTLSSSVAAAAEIATFKAAASSAKTPWALLIPQNLQAI